MLDSLQISQASELRLAIRGSWRVCGDGAAQFLDLVERIELFAERVRFDSLSLNGRAISSRHFSTLIADEQAFLQFLFDNDFAKDWLEKATVRDGGRLDAPRFWMTMTMPLDGDKGPLMQFECGAAKDTVGRLKRRNRRPSSMAMVSNALDTIFPRWIGPGIVGDHAPQPSQSWNNNPESSEPTKAKTT